MSPDAIQPSFSTASSVVVVAPVSDAKQPKTATTRVMHVINGEHFSGAERVQQHLGKLLDQFGFDPIFACVKPDKFAHCAGLREYQVCDLPMKSRFDLRVVDQLLDLAQETQSELLHAHTPRTAMVAAMASARSGLPWIYHVHSPTSRDSTRGLINRINTMIERYSIKRCDLLLTVSKSLRREMLSAGVKRQRLAVVPNGVPAIEPIAPELRVGQATWTLGMIALMRPRKGVEVALEAMQTVKSRFQSKIRLKMIGGFETEEYEQEMKSLAKKLQVNDVVDWTGFTNDIPNAIRELDALLLPSLFGEGMPMVVLESIAAGIPVVATEVEGTPEVIRHGVEGYLATPRDASSFASNICRMVSDRTSWTHMCGRALHRHRTNYSDARMAERVAKAYRRVLNEV